MAYSDNSLFSADNLAFYRDLLAQAGMDTAGINGSGGGVTEQGGVASANDPAAVARLLAALQGHRVTSELQIDGLQRENLVDPAGNIIASRVFVPGRQSWNSQNWREAATTVGGTLLAGWGAGALAGAGAGAGAGAAEGALGAGAAEGAAGAGAAAGAGGAAGGVNVAGLYGSGIGAGAGAGLGGAGAGAGAAGGTAAGSWASNPALWKAGASLVGGLASANAQGNAAQNAAAIQQQAAQQGISAQQAMFQAYQQALAPYQQAGVPAINGQMTLAGLNGPAAQQQAIDALQASPQFTSQLKLGEGRIRANASATGGLRGGNVQAALGTFSPQLLAATINDQYARLGGLTSIGENAAAGVGNAGLSTGNNVATLLQQAGAAGAGGALAQGRTNAGYWNALSNAIGLYAGLNGGGW